MRREDIAAARMAIYHLHCSHGSRQNGDSAAAEVLYVLRRGPYARGRDALLASHWANLPRWCDNDPLALFEAADRYERANARLWLELECALPVELDSDQCIDLTGAMANAVAEDRLSYVWGIHEGRSPSPGMPRNRHFHLMICERINDGVARDPARWFRRANPQRPAVGGAPKDPCLKGHQWVRDTRATYERLLNTALERAGCPERVTCESHRARMERAEAVGDHETAEGLWLHPPGMHVGPAASAIERGGPGRPGRPTERGDRARAREARAAQLRARLEEVNSKLEQHLSAVVEAARDAGVDDAIVATAQSDDPTTLIALDDATEVCRNKIRSAAAAVGLDKDGVDRLRREAEPDNPDLGWAAVVEATRERGAEMAAAESAARAVGVDPEAAYSAARDGSADPLEYLKRATGKREEEVVASARAVLLDDESISRIRRKAESTEAGSGWVAVVEATRRRGAEMTAAEWAARAVGVDPKAAYSAAWDGSADPLEYLKRATGKREEELVVSARAVLLDDKRIARIRGEAESRKPGSGWAAVSKATAERAKQKAETESAARAVSVDIDAAYREARKRQVDELEYLERVVGTCEGVVAAARAALFDTDVIAHIRREAEAKESGSGWAAVSAATAERAKRKAELETGARAVGVDVDTAYREARERQVDELEYLEREVGTCEGVVAAARAALLDTDVIAHIRREAEAKEPGSGWAAVSAATAERAKRKAEVEAAARAVGADVDIAYSEARERRVDELDYLVREVGECKQLVAAADAVFLNADAIAHIRREAEAKEPGSGWAAVSAATAERAKRKAELEAASRAAGIDVAVVYRRAWEKVEDELNYLKREIRRQAAEEAAARERLNINKVYAEARLDRRDPLTALEESTASRRRFREGVEAVARGAGVDIATCYKNGAAIGSDPVMFVEVEICARLKECVQAVFDDSRRYPLVGRVKSSGSVPECDRASVYSEIVQELTNEIAQRESGMRKDPDGNELLRRARLEVLGADQEPETWAQRSEVLVAARIERQFAVPGGDGKLFAALDRTRMDWRTKKATATAVNATTTDVVAALDSAESDPRSSSRSTPWHTLVVEAEEAYPQASSSLLRKVRSAFAESDDIDREARDVSGRLADRARVREIVAERPEPPDWAELVQRLVEWLRTQIVRLLDTVRTAGGAPPSPSLAGTTSRSQSNEQPAPALSCPVVDNPAGADNSDTFPAEEDPASWEQPASESEVQPLPNQPNVSLWVDVGEQMLTAPSAGRTRRSGDAPIPEELELVSRGGGSWDVVDDPVAQKHGVVSHLTELPDGGYRVHLRAGVEPETGSVAAIASLAHEKLVDQDFADRQRLLDEAAVAAQVSKTLSREIEEQRAPCDEDRHSGDGNEPVLVEIVEQTPTRRDSTIAVPLSALSSQALRTWMRDQDPEVYMPEFATREQIEGVGGKLKPGVSGVEIVRDFYRELRPFGQDGKLDMEAEPITVNASEVVKVYHVSSQVADDPAGVKERFKCETARDFQPRHISRQELADLAAGGGANVIDDAGAPIGYSTEDGTINLSPERVNESRDDNPRFNGQALYAVAQAELSRSGTAPAAVSSAAYLAAERLASKLGVPYTPVRLTPKHRTDLAERLQDPRSMHEVTTLADTVAKRLVDRATASGWDRSGGDRLRRIPNVRRPSVHLPSGRTTPDQKFVR